MKKPKHTGWTEQSDGSHTAKIGRTDITILPPKTWKFWRGVHNGVPCHTGPRTSHTVAFEGSHSGTAFTLAGAKALALWVILNDLTGKSPPDSIWPLEEIEVRRIWEDTVKYVNQTYGDK